jgi:hypothetical protein
MHHHTLPRRDVERVYGALSAAPRSLGSLGPLLPQYTAGQLQWAVGTLLVQGLVKEGDQAASNGLRRDPVLDVVGPFALYIGCESAK